MPRAERSIKNIPEGKGHYVGKIHFYTGDWPFRDGFVFPVVPMQKQPDAVPRPVCFLSVLHYPSADAGRDHRGELINKSAKGWLNSDKERIQTYYCQPTILVCKDHKR